MKNLKKFYESRLFLSGKSLFRRILLTILSYDKKGLANHAAGGAYGFLLSATPTLLLLSIFLLLTFRSSPHAVSDLIQKDIPFLEIIFDENWMIQNIARISHSGIPGVFSVISVIWAGRIFARSLQQGLKVIFTGNKTRNPVKENLLTLLIQFVVLVFALGFIFSSQAALYIFENLGSMPKIFPNIFSILRAHFLPFGALGIITYGAYRIIPANSPRPFSAMRGTFFCIIAYSLTYSILQFIINKTRYNFLYGALGELIILLVSVYFFFVFFFLGAQFAKVIEAQDVLLFSNLLQARKKSTKETYSLWEKIFFVPDGPLAKYLRHYNKGEIIFKKGDNTTDIYYLLNGSVEIFGRTTKAEDLPSASTLEAGVFFGEMGHLLSEKRNATVKTKTEVTVLILPPRLFDEALNYDTGIDRTVIDGLTQRLSSANK